MTERFDVVIIGSGGGGAPIANRLALKDKSVLVLDKGPLLRPDYQIPSRRSDFRRDEMVTATPEKILRIPGLGNNGVSYYNSHVEPDLNDEPHIYVDPKTGSDYATIEGYTAQVVGGGTQLYGGVSLRFTPTDMQLQSFNAGRVLKNDPKGDVQREARNWPISYQQLEPYYALAEELVGINGTTANQQKPFTSGDKYQPPLNPNPISKFAFAGMSALGQQWADTFGKNGPNVQPYRTPLAVITRDHGPSSRTIPRNEKGVPDPEAAKTSFVNRYGDPLGLKSNTWVSLLSPVAGRDNFKIRANCVVTRLSAEGGLVTKVHYLDPGGTERTVEGKVVIVACSAIESVRLLMLSGQADSAFAGRINKSGLLGKYFLTHCFGGARAIVPGRYDKSKALDADWATDCCATDAFLDANGLWAGAAIYNNTSDSALPLSLFRTHYSQDLDSLWKGFMQDADMRADKFIDFLDREFGRSLSVSFMANQVPQRENRIELHPSVRDKWGRPVAYVRKTWHEHDRYLMDQMAQQCAAILRYGIKAFDPKYDPDSPTGGGLSMGGIYQADDAVARMANHILGGARFGTDPKDSVLDLNNRAWEFDNLFVTDGSFMPTSGGANPTLTIQANALRVADHLLASGLV